MAQINLVKFQQQKSETNCSQHFYWVWFVVALNLPDQPPPYSFSLQISSRIHKDSKGVVAFIHPCLFCRHPPIITYVGQLGDVQAGCAADDSVIRVRMTVNCLYIYGYKLSTGTYQWYVIGDQLLPQYL